MGLGRPRGKVLSSSHHFKGPHYELDPAVLVLPDHLAEVLIVWFSTVKSLFCTPLSVLYFGKAVTVHSPDLRRGRLCSSSFRAVYLDWLFGILLSIIFDQSFVLIPHSMCFLDRLAEQWESNSDTETTNPESFDWNKGDQILPGILELSSFFPSLLQEIRTVCYAPGTALALGTQWEVKRIWSLRAQRLVTVASNLATKSEKASWRLWLLS